MESRSTVLWLCPLGIGATAMFLLDPSRGRRRRALLRDKAASMARRSQLSARGLAEDLQNRARGVVARARSTDTSAVVDDGVVVARVRSAIGRVASHPGSLGVASLNGVVELNGPVLAQEHAAVMQTVESTRGVVAVIDNTTQHEDASNVPGLQGEGLLHDRRSWSKTAIAAACGAAAVLVVALGRRVTVRRAVAAQTGSALE